VGVSDRVKSKPLGGQGRQTQRWPHSSHIAPGPEPDSHHTPRSLVTLKKSQIHRPLTLVSTLSHDASTSINPKTIGAQRIHKGAQPPCTDSANNAHSGARERRWGGSRGDSQGCVTSASERTDLAKIATKITVLASVTHCRLCVPINRIPHHCLLSLHVRTLGCYCIA